METFYELAVRSAKKQSVLVDRLTKATPILRRLPMMPTSNGLSNVYEEIVSIDSAEEVDFDAPVPTVDVDSELKEVQLSKFAAEMYVGLDKMEKLNPKISVASYFAQKADKIAKKTGMNMEYAMLYNVFRSKAIAAGNYTKVGGSNSKNYSLVIVTFEPGENMGLYDPEGFGRGDVMDFIPVNNLAPHKITVGGKTFLGYNMQMQTYFGLQIANVNGLYVLPNIDLDQTGTPLAYKAIPTAAMIDDALDAVEADPASTMIMGHPRLLAALGEIYKGDIVRMSNEQKDIDTMISSWNTIPMISSRNFSKAGEPNVA